MSNSQDYNESDEDPFGPRHEKLRAVQVRLTPESSPDPGNLLLLNPVSARKGTKAKRRKIRLNPGDSFLLAHLAPNRPDIAKAAATTQINCNSDCDTEGGSGDSDAGVDDTDLDTIIAKKMEEREQALKREEELKAAMIARERLQKGQEATRIAAKALSLSATPRPLMREVAADDTEMRNGVTADESSHAEARGLGISKESSASPDFKVPNYERVSQTPASTTLGSPLEARQHSYCNGHRDESLVTSPLSVHLKQADSPGHRLPALQSPGSPDGPSSPQNQKLPSFRQIDEIATKAKEARRFSMSGPSPTMSYPSGPVRSPFPISHPSPSMMSDASSRQALSPPSGISGQFFMSRRPSQASDYPSALPSASATDSSYASTDGYSPSMQQTPQSDTHRMSIDGTGPPILPPPVPSLQLTIHTIPAHGSGGFKCDYSGCTAAPFQTQYLLNSHANVHSQNRPHYCPVRGCPRAEGGKGFKRKNEMIRHGLVHDSPGYVCPFCPEREHRYPRPDNLQRHVKVHHVDKNKDDQQLRDVLDQRPEGGNSRGRRRRLGS